MGCECCKPRLEEIPARLPPKPIKSTQAESMREQLLQDLETLRRNIKAPKNSAATPQALWTLADFKTYGEFLTALALQAEALEQSPAIQMLGLPTEGVDPEEARSRCEAMSAFISELRNLHEPGALPDADWLEAAKQLVGKKTVFLACKRRYEQLVKQSHDYQDAMATVEGDKVLAVQKEVGETLDGYCTVIQLTERIFQAISFLSRVALGMQARIDVLTGHSLPNTDRPVAQPRLEMEIRA